MEGSLPLSLHQEAPRIQLRNLLCFPHPPLSFPATAGRCPAPRWLSHRRVPRPRRLSHRRVPLPDGFPTAGPPSPTAFPLQGPPSPTAFPLQGPASRTAFPLQDPFTCVVGRPLWFASASCDFHDSLISTITFLSVIPSQLPTHTLLSSSRWCWSHRFYS